MIVKSTLPAGKVCLWERHPAHPGGEVFIADNSPHEAGDTAEIQIRLKRGLLVEVKPEPEPEKPIPAQQAAQASKSRKRR